MYLYAMIDVYSRYVLGWRLSNTLSARNCYELLQECIEQHGAPEIVYRPRKPIHNGGMGAAIGG